MRQTDIHFALTLVLNALIPPRKHHGVSNSAALSGAMGMPKSNSMSMGEIGRTGSLSSGHGKQINTPKEVLQNVAFLGAFICCCVVADNIVCLQV